MIIDLLRYSDNRESTLGLFFIDKKFESYTLEDEFRAVKVAGETRIPADIYEVQFREVLSPKTKEYRKKFKWFTWHLQIMDVPNFEWVYIHIGNKDDHTDACVLLADSANNNTIADGFIGSSTPAFERAYKKISAALIKGERVFIHIKDSPL
jgi:hypothetical protein